MVCRRNLFRGKKQIKGKERGGGEGGGARETSSTSQGFPRRRRGGRDREKEKPAGTGSEENPDGKALSSRSRVHSLSSLDFPSLLLLPPLVPRTPVGTLWSRRKYLNDIFFLPLPVLLRSKNYTSRLCSWCTGTIINCLSFLSRNINHRGNKIFLLTRCRERDGTSIPTISRDATFSSPVISCNDKMHIFSSLNEILIPFHLELSFECFQVSSAIYIAVNERFYYYSL